MFFVTLMEGPCHICILIHIKSTEIFDTPMISKDMRKMGGIIKLTQVVVGLLVLDQVFEGGFTTA